MSDHGEQKAREILVGVTPVGAPLEIRAMRIDSPSADPLAELQELLKDAADHAAIVITKITTAVRDPSVTLRARDLRQLVQEEIDRAAAAAADVWDEMKLEDVEIERDILKDRVYVLENALLPFAEAGKRFFITGDGSYSDAFADLKQPHIMRAAFQAMSGHGL